MKKILIILGIVTLIEINTINLISCNKTEYNEIELKKLKDKNNIKLKDGILEGISSQEKPFNNIDNKYYYIIGRGENYHNGKLIKFKNNKQDKLKNKDNYNNYKLALVQNGNGHHIFDLTIQKNKSKGIFGHDNNQYFKSVYRGNGDGKPDINIENKLKNYL